MDVGTTAVKVAALDDTGRALGEARRPTPVAHDDYGPVHRHGSLRRAVEAAILDCVTSVRGGRMAGLAVASTGEEGFPLDQQGRVLYPSIVWHDRRAEEFCARWIGQHDPVAAYNRTGLTADPIRTQFKLAWLGREVPSLRPAITRWISLSEYLGLVWTGECAFTPSQASRTFLWDLRRGEWCRDWIDALEFPHLTFPKVRASGEVLGQVRSGELRSIPKAENTVVVLAGHDHPTAAAMAGMRGGDDLLDSMGTAESMMVSLKRVRATQEALANGLEYGQAVVDGPYYATTVAHYGADVGRWRRTLRPSPARLDLLARQVPPGAAGVRYYPAHWTGQRKGRLFGLTSNFDVGVLYRAVLEGWAFQTKRAVASLEQAAGAPIRRLRAVGGGTKGRLALEIRASVLGRPIEIVSMDEAGALGAAAVAFKTLTGQQGKFESVGTVDPVPEWQAAYAEWETPGPTSHGEGLTVTPR